MVMAAKSIVCFSVNDWSDIPSSKFHIMRHLAKDHRVLFIETLGVRHPQLSSKDAKRALMKLRKSFSGVRKVESNIYVWSPLAIPYHGFPFINWINSRIVATMVKRLLAKLEMTASIIWSYLPNAIDIIERLPASRTVYHCIDDYVEFTGVPKAAFEQMEKRMLRKADVTVVSSKVLYERKKLHANRITYIPHGINLTEFRACLSRSVNLSDIDDIKKPIAGFVGRVADWVDLSLIARCARELPDWEFVIVGPSIVPLDQYQAISNIRFLGRKEYQQIPHYIERFDVCLMPFVNSRLVESVNPLKMYEYLAIGRPVVTVPMPEVTDFAQVLTVAEPSQFSRAIVTAFEADSEALRAKRIECVSKRSWGDIAEAILALIGTDARIASSAESRGQRRADTCIDLRRLPELGMQNAFDSGLRAQSSRRTEGV
jgi:glycosyltransferase involved in cell wall biosynthesis